MQITSQISSNSPSLSQECLMHVLDEMQKQAKKLKEHKKKRKANQPSGHLDTQLFPKWWKTHPMKAEAQIKIRAMFKNNSWTISDGKSEATLSINELFPSNKYDILQVKSEDFGRALALRLTNGNVEEEARKLISENKQKTYDISETKIDEAKIIEIVCDVIPLNDYQREIRDAVEGKSYGN